MLAFQSSTSLPDDSLEPDQPSASLSLHTGCIVKIRTASMGHGEVTFDASHQFHGAWDWDGTPCHANGRIDIVDELQRANVHLVITHGTHVLADVQLTFDLLIETSKPPAR